MASKKQTNASAKKAEAASLKEAKSKTKSPKSARQSSLGSGTPLTHEELSAMVKRDHEKIEEIHTYLKQLRWLSGIRLLITVALVIIPIIIAAIAIPPLLSSVEGALTNTGILNADGEFDPESLFQGMMGEQMESMFQGGEYPEGGSLEQPPADFDTWTQEEQEEWVRNQFDG